MARFLYCENCRKNQLFKDNFHCWIVIVSIILMVVGIFLIVPFIIGLVILIAYVIYYNVKKPYKCKVCGGDVYSERREEVPVSNTLTVQSGEPVQNVVRKYCSNCGSAINADDRHCGNCGMEL